MKRTISIYCAYFLQYLKARMDYKWDFFATIFSGMFVTLGGLLFIVFLMDGKTVTALAGWQRTEVLFIYGYSLIATGLFSMLSRNLYQFGDRYVIQGEFDRVLLRPLNSLCQVIFESFHLEGVGSLLTGIVLVSYTSQDLAISMGVLDLLWLGFSALCGSVILLSIFVTLCSLSFHFEDRIGILPPFYNLMQFGRYPLPIYNKFVQIILSWIVPYAFVAFYPATYFFSREGFEWYCYLTPLVAISWVSIMSVMWSVGVSRYSSTGS